MNSRNNPDAPNPELTNAPPFLLFLENRDSDPIGSPTIIDNISSADGAWTTELTVKTFENVDYDDVILDFDMDSLKCFSSSSTSKIEITDVGLDVDDDIFSIYLDVKELEEEKENNNVVEVGGALDSDILQNGGGFVAGSCAGSGCRGRRKGKENKCNKISTGNVKGTQARKHRERRGLMKGICMVDDEKGFVEPRKAMAPEELAELWAIDPKRAKRIVANRHSAARSKERKAQYIINQEEKVKVLNSEVTLLNTRLATSQRETTELVAEKSELKCQLQALESEAEQIDAQNAAFKLEIDWLKSVTGELDSSSSHVHQPAAAAALHFPFTPMSTHQKPLHHNCQPTMLPSYLHVASPQPLF